MIGMLRFSSLGLLTLALTGCWWDDSPTAPVRAPRNTFVDYQHIGGLVSGVWTKEHNPHVIKGITRVQDGDSLVIQAGVEIIANVTLYVERNSRLSFEGNSNSPIKFVHNDPQFGGGVFGGTGSFRAKYTIFEGHGKAILVGMDSRIEHCVFSEILLKFSQFYPDPYDSTIVRNCIFAGYRPWDSRQGGTQVSTTDNYSFDSSKTDVRNNIFYTGIGDSTWALNPDPVVDVWVKGQGAAKHIRAISWPGTGTKFADPKWVKYDFVGPSPAGISGNDYHLLPGSAGIGAAHDGTNIGAY